MPVGFFDGNDKRNNLSHILLESDNVENLTFNWRPFCFCCIISFFWPNLIKRWPIFVILVSKCSGKRFISTKSVYEGSKCTNNFSTYEERKNMDGYNFTCKIPVAMATMAANILCARHHQVIRPSFIFQNIYNFTML